MADDRGGLEARIRAIEDRLAIYELVASYGPAVDAGEVDAAASLWSEDGDYLVPGFDILAGRAGVEALLLGPFHQQLIAGGSAHLLALPTVRIDGEQAVAIGYAHVVVPADDGFRLLRSVATRWDLQREDGRWVCVRRTNEPLDGRPEARRLLSGR